MDDWSDRSVDSRGGSSVSPDIDIDDGGACVSITGEGSSSASAPDNNGCISAPCLASRLARSGSPSSEYRERTLRIDAAWAFVADMCANTVIGACVAERGRGVGSDRMLTGALVAVDISVSVGNERGGTLLRAGETTPSTSGGGVGGGRSA